MPQKNCNSIAYCKMLILLFAECCNIIHHLPDCTFLCYLKKFPQKEGKLSENLGWFGLHLLKKKAVVMGQKCNVEQNIQDKRVLMSSDSFPVGYMICFCYYFIVLRV